MDWFQVGVAAGCGAIGGVVGAISGFLIRNPKYKQVAVVAVTVATFTLLNGWARTSIIPEHQKQRQISEFEAKISGNPAFIAIQEYAPESMAEIRMYLEEAIENSYDSVTVETHTRKIIAGAVSSKISRASDNAVLNLVGLTIDQMKALRERGDDSCFAFLHPNVAKGVSLANLFSEEIELRDQESTHLILSTYDEARVGPNTAEAQTAFEPIVTALIESHGQEAVAQLANVADPGTNRAQVCSITIDMYSAVLAQERNETVNTLRWLFSQI